MELGLAMRARWRQSKPYNNEILESEWQARKLPPSVDCSETSHGSRMASSLLGTKMRGGVDAAGTNNAMMECIRVLEAMRHGDMQASPRMSLEGSEAWGGRVKK